MAGTTIVYDDQIAYAPFHRAVHHHALHALQYQSLLIPCQDPGDTIKVRVGTDVYFCNESDVLQHLPNLQLGAIGNTLVVQDYVSTKHCSRQQKDAAHHLFRGLQQYRMTGLGLDLFEQVSASLSHARARGDMSLAREAVKLVRGLCLLLDWEHGLGCSNHVLAQIDSFVQDLFYKYPPDYPHDRANTSELFDAYSKVLKLDGAYRQRHLETVQALWYVLPGPWRAAHREKMARQLDSWPLRSNDQEMFQALRELGIC